MKRITEKFGEAGGKKNGLSPAYRRGWVKILTDKTEGGR